MYCSKCGNQTIPNDKFCEKCGNLITNPYKRPALE